MTTAHLTRIATFATVTAVSAFTLTACGGSSDSPDGPAAAATSSAPAEPREVLLNAVPDAETTAYTFKIKGGDAPMSGVIDNPKKALELTYAESDKDAGFTMKLDTRKVGEKAWMKITFTPAGLPGLPKLPKKWMLLDPAKFDDKSLFESSDESDPGYTTILVENAAGLKEVSPGHYAGTTDLTKATDADILEAAKLKSLGAAAKKVPFEAVVDGAGNLTSVVVKIPAAGKTKASTYSVTYGGYGKTTTPAEPAADEQQKAPASVYELLNG